MSNRRLLLLLVGASAALGLPGNFGYCEKRSEEANYVEQLSRACSSSKSIAQLARALEGLSAESFLDIYSDVYYRRVNQTGPETAKRIAVGRKMIQLLLDDSKEILRKQESRIEEIEALLKLKQIVSNGKGYRVLVLKYFLTALADYMALDRICGSKIDDEERKALWRLLQANLKEGYVAQELARTVEQELGENLFPHAKVQAMPLHERFMLIYESKEVKEHVKRLYPDTEEKISELSRGMLVKHNYDFFDVQEGLVFFAAFWKLQQEVLEVALIYLEKNEVLPSEEKHFLDKLGENLEAKIRARYNMLHEEELTPEFVWEMIKKQRKFLGKIFVFDPLPLRESGP